MGMICSVPETEREPLWLVHNEPRGMAAGRQTGDGTWLMGKNKTLHFILIAMRSQQRILSRWITWSILRFEKRSFILLHGEWIVGEQEGRQSGDCLNGLGSGDGGWFGLASICYHRDEKEGRNSGYIKRYF